LVPVREETKVDDDLAEVELVDTWRTRLENHIDHIPVIDE
jgi:hypothetical protein